MRYFLAIFAVLFLCAFPIHAQTLKSLMFSTNNGQIVANTTTLTFTNVTSWGGDFTIGANGEFSYGGTLIFEPETQTWFMPFGFSDPEYASITLTNLGLGSNGTLQINTLTASQEVVAVSGTNWVRINTSSLNFSGPNQAAATRTNLGLGESNVVTFAGLTNNGDIRINQTATNNGLLYIYRTNSEAFLGLANLIASNNTTISNETLFRVGVAEATNKSAQFGFRSTNTNGNGVAVFSVFGFNALMQIGSDASTNAVIYSGGGTNNEVMTLIRDGATEFARPLRFSTNAASKPATNAPANTTNAAAWVEMQIGTNSYRVPLYQ